MRGPRVPREDPPPPPTVPARFPRVPGVQEGGDVRRVLGHPAIQPDTVLHSHLRYQVGGLGAGVEPAQL